MFNIKKKCEIVVTGGDVTRVIDMLNSLKIGSKLSFRNYNADSGIKIIKFKTCRRAYDLLMHELKRGHVVTLCRTYDMFGRTIWQEL